MRHISKPKRHMGRIMSAWSVGILAVIAALMMPGQVFAQSGQSCNSKLNYQITGPNGNWFVGDELTVTAYLGAGGITGGNYLDIPDFGFAGDCQQKVGLTYHNCQAPNPANEIEYIGAIQVVENCVNPNGEDITFFPPQSSFIDFIPANGPIRLEPDEYCTVSWKFKVAGLADGLTSTTLYQALSFPVVDPQNEPAICDNDRTTSNDRSGHFGINSCLIDVEKQICDPVGTNCELEENWYNADTAPEALLLSPSGLAAYRAIITNTGSVAYDGDIKIDDTILGIHTTTDPLAPGASVTVGGAAAQANWSQACSSTTDITNTLEVLASCRNDEVTAGASNSAWGDCSLFDDETPQPGMTIEKATNGQDADVAPGPTIPVGSTVTWSYVVKNTGNVTLTGITAADDLEGAISCPKASLEPNESMICTSKNGTAVAGQYENVASVSGTSETGPASDTDPSHYFGGAQSMTIEKATNGEDADLAPGPNILVGSPVTWSYVVKNTGTVTITGITASDDLEGAITCPKTSLEPGESMNCTSKNGTAAAGQYANVASVSGTSETGPASDTDPSHYFGGAQSMTIEKATNGEDADSAPGPTIAVDGPVVWSYVVKNTGNVTITDITASDDLEGAITCPKTSLEPDESMNCTSKNGTAAAGQYANVASVSGTSEAGPASDTDPSHYFGGAQSMTIEKATNGEDADSAPGPTIAVDGPVVWSYVVKNTGTVTITGITASDDVEGAISCPKTSLEPDESMNCTSKNGTAAAGQYANVASVSGTSETGPASDTDPSHYFGGAQSMTIEKATNGEDADSAPGPTIAVDGPVVWSYVVKNTGTVTITGITASDDLEGAITCPKTSLEPDESMNCTSKNGTAAAGQYANVASVSGTSETGPASDTDPSHYFGGAQSITIEKATNGDDADEEPGPTIGIDNAVEWSYVIENTGNVTITDITASDDLEGAITCPKTSLEPDESMNCTSKNGTAAAGQYANVASVSGTSETGPASDDDPSHYFGADAAIMLTKTADQETFEVAGEEVGYTFVVENNGNVILTSVTVTDPQIAVISCDWDNSSDGNTPAGTLSVGETVTCTGTYTILPADVTAEKFDNTATATGKDPDDGDVSDDDDETITLKAIFLNAAAECANDVPWVSWSVDVVGIDDPFQVTYSWLNGNTVVAGPFNLTTSTSDSGYMLWPNASATGDYPTAVGTGWPGWQEGPPGTWTEVASDKKPNLTLKVSVNPDDEVALTYPPAEPFCDASPPPVLDIQKSVTNLMENPDGTIDVTYRVNVSNTGGQTEVYTLQDYLKVDEALSVNTAVNPVVVTYIPGNVDSNLGTLGSPNPTDFESPPGAVLVSDEQIEPGNNEGFEFTLTFDIDGTETTVAGANCETDDDNGGNTGTTNHVDLVVDQSIVDSAEACEPFPLTPEIEIIKEVSIDGGQNYEDDTAGPVAPPSGAIYRIQVKNVGNVDLPEVSITDSMILGGPYVFGPLNVGEDFTVIEWDAGPDGGWPELNFAEICDSTANITNIATATAMFEGVEYTATNPANVICIGEPMISIIKQVKIGNGVWQDADLPEDFPLVVYDPQNPVSAMYRFVVANIGTVDLVDVVVTDPDRFPGSYNVGDLDVGSDPVTITSGDIPQLAVDSICVGIGNVANVATVNATSADDANDTDMDTDPATVNCVGKPDIDIVKQVSSNGTDWADSATADAISDAYYRIAVTNTGSTDLVNVVVVDNDLGINQVIGNLAVGETVTLVPENAGQDEILVTDLYLPGFCDEAFEYENTASVSGDPVYEGNSVMDEATATFTCEDELPTGDLCGPNGDDRPDSIKVRYMGYSALIIGVAGTTPEVDPLVVDLGAYDDVDIYFLDGRGQGGDKASDVIIDYQDVEPLDYMDFSGNDNTGKVPPTTVIRIYADCPNFDDASCDSTLLQVITFHTSCSQPLTPGDQFGGIMLISSN